MLPMNTGYEAPGKSLVLDFESPLFIGTMLMRVAGVGPFDSAISPLIATTSYFDDKQRQFQVIIQGRFRRSDIPCSECFTGQMFDRCAGKLPAKLVVQTVIRVMASLAPQLEATLHGDRPCFLTPLVATAQTVLIRTPLSSDAVSTRMEEELEEPLGNDPKSAMSTILANPTVGPHTIEQRRASRKRAFNRLTATRAMDPVFDTSKEYTFEFFQHMLSLTETDDLKLLVAGRFRVGLADALNGRPVKILGVQRTRTASNVLWSFDLWHQSLYPLATSYR
jgi:Protein of unknown function (DUF1769)